MKLELKYIAPYLPYGLKGIITYHADNKEICTLGVKCDINNVCDIYDFLNSSYDLKPILRPLSDLTKEIEVNGEKFVPILEMERIFKINPLWEGWDFKHIAVELPIEIWNKLFEWHFDVFGLIPQGLAIDINTL